MILDLIEFKDISVIDQNGQEDIINISSLSYKDVQLGAGGFGGIYKVTSINGVQTEKYLIKVYSNLEAKSHALETIKVLHAKLRRVQVKNSAPVFHLYPELYGLPFMAFNAIEESERKDITAFLMHDLNEMGYTDLGKDADNERNFFSNIELKDRFYLAFRLITVFTFLKDLGFVHSDIRLDSFFIDPTNLRLALIDFDSGYNITVQSKPSTIGALNHWLSGRARMIIKKLIPSDTITDNDRLDEENWVLSNAVFEFIFGTVPFFFLKDAEEQTIESYLKEFTWPVIDPASDLINKRNLTAHINLIEFIEAMENGGFAELVLAFKKNFNKGFSSSYLRTTTDEWYKTLKKINEEFLNKPSITNFKSDKNQITFTGEIITFNWEVRGASRIWLDDIPVTLDFNSLAISFKDSKIVNLKVDNGVETTYETIKIDAIKIEPSIASFQSSVAKRIDLSPVTISWETLNCSKVEIVNTASNQPPVGTIIVDPLAKTTYKLKAIGFFNQEVIQEIIVDVTPPEIKFFRYEVNIERGISNIDLFWSVINAEKVEINPLIGDVDLVANTFISIGNSTQFTLNATSSFGNVVKNIEAHPFPIPIVKEILVPSPSIEILTAITTDFIKAPDYFYKSTQIDFNNSINIVSEQKQHYNIKLPEFVTLDNSFHSSPKSDSWFKSLFNKVFNNHIK